MTCPKCNIEMEKGLLAADSQHWLKENSFSARISKVTNWGTTRIWAWRCLECKKVELEAE